MTQLNFLHYLEAKGQFFFKRVDVILIIFIENFNILEKKFLSHLSVHYGVAD
jgi:hypothetical protein